MMKNLENIYLKIDEKYSEYKTTENFESLEDKRSSLRTELMTLTWKMVLINPYFTKLLDSDIYVFDGTTIAIAVDHALNKFPNLYGNFHDYLLKCIDNQKNKDTSEFIDSPLSSTERELLIKIKRVLKQCDNDYKKAAYFLNISEEEISDILKKEKLYSLNYCKDKDNPKTSIAETKEDKKIISPEKKLDFCNSIIEELSIIEKEWENTKPIHQPIISDFFTAKILSFKNEKILSFLETPEKMKELLFRFSFINKEMVKKFITDDNYTLPLTFDLIAKNHGVQKGAVSKDIKKIEESLLNSGILKKDNLGKKVKKV